MIDFGSADLNDWTVVSAFDKLTLFSTFPNISPSASAMPPRKQENAVLAFN